MKIKKGHIYIADLNPRMGTKPDKIRPVVVVQTDLLNGVHPSTIISPITSNIQLKAGDGGLEKPSDILLDQVQVIENQRLVKNTGELTPESMTKLMENLRIFLDL